MSKRNRAMAKEKRLNSPKAKMKRAKQNYYKSPAAKEKWEEKKARKNGEYSEDDT